MCVCVCVCVCVLEGALGVRVSLLCCLSWSQSISIVVVSDDFDVSC